MNKLPFITSQFLGMAITESLAADDRGAEIETSKAEEYLPDAMNFTLSNSQHYGLSRWIQEMQKSYTCYQAPPVEVVAVPDHSAERIRLAEEKRQRKLEKKQKK